MPAADRVVGLDQQLQRAREGIICLAGLRILTARKNKPRYRSSGASHHSSRGRIVQGATKSSIRIRARVSFGTRGSGSRAIAV